MYGTMINYIACSDSTMDYQVNTIVKAIRPIFAHLLCLLNNCLPKLYWKLDYAQDQLNKLTSNINSEHLCLQMK